MNVFDHPKQCSKHVIKHLLKHFFTIIFYEMSINLHTIIDLCYMDSEKKRCNVQDVNTFEFIKDQATTIYNVFNINPVVCT